VTPTSKVPMVTTGHRSQQCRTPPLNNEQRLATRHVPKPLRSHRATPSTPAIISTIPNPYKDFEDIIKPINRSVALRKSRYNLKTVARDMLIATSRHPYQRGLNAHLEPLKARFRTVDGSSDLSTFRWCIVDPGSRPLGQQICQPLWKNCRTSHL
jgi:hypothetical protein